MREITKEYPAVHALKRVNLHVNKGEIVGLVGANGAGKSTLVKILGGMVRNYAGAISIRDTEVRLTSPVDSQRLGIAILPQEPQFAWNLSVCDNLLLSSGVRSAWFTPSRRDLRRKRCQAVLSRYAKGLSPGTTTGLLSRRELQLLQIARLVLCDSSLLVLDEPTTALSHTESQDFFAFVRARAARGAGLILISHNIDDVFAVCDRIVVLRDGAKITDVARAETTRSAILSDMFGPAPPQREHEQELTAKTNALEVRALKIGDIPNLSFCLKQGEALGVASRSSEATDLLRTLYGLNNEAVTDVRVFGQRMEIKSPQEAQRAGFGYIPEDRVRDGLFPSLNVLLNIALLVLPCCRKRGVLDWKVLRETAGRVATSLRIAVPSLDSEINVLSGGNQQRVLLGRWLCKGARVYLLEEPTSGMDVAAKEEVTSIIKLLRREGDSILMSSSDPDELLRICNRILVLSPDRCVEIDANEPGGRTSLISALSNSGTL